MEFIGVLNAVIANGIMLIVLIYALINIHISKYHLKVMDKIVYGRQIPKRMIIMFLKPCERWSI